MPRRPRPTPQQAATTTLSVPVPASAPTARNVTGLLTTARTADTNVEAIREGLAAAAAAVPGLQRKAFGWIRQLDRMAAEDLHDFMGHFLRYYDVTGLAARAASAPRLPTGDEPEVIERQGEQTTIPAQTRGFPTQPPAGNA